MELIYIWTGIEFIIMFIVGIYFSIRLWYEIVKDSKEQQDDKRIIENLTKNNPEYREILRSIKEASAPISEEVMFGLYEGKLGVRGRRYYELIRWIQSLDIE